MVRLFLLLAFFVGEVSGATAIEEYETAQIRDQGFLGKAFEAGKEYLHQGRIEEVLTITTFYRLNFLKDQKSRAHFFQEGFYQLEVISLSKLCQWNHIDKILSEYEEALRENDKSLEKYHELRKQVEQSKILQDTLKEAKAPTEPEMENFLNLVAYKVPHEVLEHASHPKDFTLRIGNKCTKRY